MDSIASVTMATGGHYTCSNRHAACWLHHMIFFALQILCWMMLWNPSTIKRDLELQSTILIHNLKKSRPIPLSLHLIQQWTLTGKVWEASADEHQNDFQLLVQPCYSLLVDSAILQQHIVDLLGCQWTLELLAIQHLCLQNLNWLDKEKKAVLEYL